MKSEDLSTLLSRAAGERDLDALKALYAATVGKLFAVALMITARRDVAEEVVAEVFIRVGQGDIIWRPDEEAPLTVLIGLTRRRALERARADLASTMPRDDGGDGTHGAFGDARTVTFCDAPLVQKLAPRQRDLLTSAYLFGASRSQLAQRSGLAESEVRSEIAAALHDLRSMASPG